LERKIAAQEELGIGKYSLAVRMVLIIDADERITPRLEREIREAIGRTDVDGFLSQPSVLVFGQVDKSLRLFSKLEPAPVPASPRPI
jgi:hypothetical protein